MQEVTNNQLFDYMTKIYGELTGVKGEVTGIKEEVVGIKEEVAGIKEEMTSMKGDITSMKGDIVRMENKMDEKFGALFDGYAANTQAIVGLTGQVGKLQKIVSSHEVHLKVVK